VSCGGCLLGGWRADLHAVRYGLANPTQEEIKNYKKPLFEKK